MPKQHKTIVECKTTNKNGKRALIYQNNRTKKSLPIVVGKRGGLSVKSPGSKTRRYVRTMCKKRAHSSSLFWTTVQQKVKKNKTMKKKKSLKTKSKK